MADDTAEDEREEELSSILAIFPELAIDPTDPFAASLEIPVAPVDPIKVRFPPPIDGSLNLLPPGANGTRTTSGEDTHTLTHLPPIQLHLTLPEGYPNNKPPSVHLTTSPNWLPATTLEQLQEQAALLWEEYGHMQVVFAYIDHLQQAAENGFDIGDGAMSVDQELKIALLDFDITMKRHKFDQETFDCGVCLEPKKGSACYRLQKCGHVFCVECLQDFYVNAITEGDIANIKCLAPDCGVERDASTRRAKKAARTLGPNELLKIPIERSLVQRYVDLKRKKKLESSKDTVYCPRKWCQGPASVKRRVKKELSQLEDDDSASESEEGSTADKEKKAEEKVSAANDRLRICESCDYAFCRICLLGWHGDFVRCWPKSSAELNEEEQASYDYILKHTSPCPTCSSPCQKTHGCNHMQCYQCNTHFCYLCSAWLDAQNPYAHFNNNKIGCYQRLWELEEGDEGEGQGRFEGARGWEAAAAAAAEADAADRARVQQQQQQQQPEVQNVQPVAPAVAQQPAPPPPAPVAVQQAAPPRPVPVPAVVAMDPLDEEIAQILREMHGHPRGARIAARDRIMNFDWPVQDIDELLQALEDHDGGPGWRIPGVVPNAAGRPRQARLPQLGGAGHFANPGRRYQRRRANDGEEARREVAGLGQRNYLRQVRADDPAVQPVVEIAALMNVGQAANDGNDGLGRDGLAEPDLPLEEPPEFVIVPARGRGGRNGGRGARGRGR